MADQEQTVALYMHWPAYRLARAEFIRVFNDFKAGVSSPEQLSQVFQRILEVQDDVSREIRDFGLAVARSKADLSDEVGRTRHPTYRRRAVHKPHQRAPRRDQ